jgi:hypothetical protein
MVLAIALFRTQRGAILAAMAGVALLVLAGLLIERGTVTDTKLVRQTLDAAAAGLATNDAKQVLPCIVPGPDGNRARDLIGWALARAEFIELSVRNLEVKFNYQTSPPTADTTFTVWVVGKDHSGTLAGEISRPVAMTVQLRKESGRWLICGEPTHDVRE